MVGGGVTVWLLMGVAESEGLDAEQALEVVMRALRTYRDVEPNAATARLLVFETIELARGAMTGFADVKDMVD